MSTDGSTTIPAAGAAVLLFGGIIPAAGYEICNVDEVWDLWISDTTTAAKNGAGSICVGPGGGTYTTPRDYRPLGPVSVISYKSSEHKVTARAWDTVGGGSGSSPGPMGPAGPAGPTGPAGPMGPSGAGGVDTSKVSAMQFLTNNGVNNSTTAWANMMSYMTTTSGTSLAARLPSLTAKVLRFPGGSYKMAAFTPLPFWGTGASIEGDGLATVLDNIGIDWGQWRGTCIQNLWLADRDQIIKPNTYGMYVHAAPRGGWATNIMILYRDIGIKVAQTNNYSPFPAHISFTNIYQAFGRIGLFTQGPFAVMMDNCTFGSNDDFCWLLYGPQGFKPNNCFVNGGGINAIKVTGNERRPSTDSYFGYITSTGVSTSTPGPPIYTRYPIIATAEEDGDTRITLTTKMEVQITPHASIMSWDPYIKYAKCLNTVSGTSGQLNSLTVGGVNLISAPIAWAGTIAATVQAIKNNINAGTGTHGFTAFAAGLGSQRFYIDKAGDTPATEPAALALIGQPVVAVTSGGDLLVRTEDYIQVTFPSPHGYVRGKTINHRGYKSACIGFIDNGAGGAVPSGVPGTVMNIAEWVGDPIKVGQQVKGTSVVIVTDDTVVVSQLTGTPGGIGTYQVSVPSATVNGALFTGTDYYDGEMKIACVPSSTTVLYQMPYTDPCVGQAWKLLQFTNGETQCVIDGATVTGFLSLNDMDDVSIRVNVPWGTLNLPSDFATRPFDVSYEVLDTSSIRLNDHYWIGGNVNYFEINGYNHIYWMPRPGKIFLWVSDPANPSLKPKRIFFIRPGRGRTTDDDDPDTETNLVPICGANSGWASFEMAEDEHGNSFAQVVVPSAVGEKVANQPPTNTFRITNTEMLSILGDDMVSHLTQSGLETPWLHAHQTVPGEAAHLNRLEVITGATGGGPTLRPQSTGDTPDTNATLRFDALGPTGYQRFFAGNTEKVRIEAGTSGALVMRPGVPLALPTDRSGNAVLVAGTVTVAAPTVSTSTIVSLTRKTIGGTVGNLSYTVSSGVGFTINSSSVTDTSTISWLLIRSL